MVATASSAGGRDDGAYSGDGVINYHIPSLFAVFKFELGADAGLVCDDLGINAVWSGRISQCVF